MYITSIYIRNFQSHEDTKIDFHAGVNAIVGLSDSGKSTIRRAIQWVFTNKPQGDSFRRHNTDYTEVSITFADGLTVSRIKDKKENIYKLITPDGKEQIYKAFKNELPLDIQQALNINHLNLQAQIEAPFMLSNSPSEIAKTLNQIVNLDKIDSSISFIRRKLINSQSEKKRLEQNITENTEKLKEFDVIPEIQTLVLSYETIDKEVDTLKLSIATLDNMLDDLDHYTDALLVYKKASEAEKILNTCVTLQEHIKSIRGDYKTLQDILTDLRRYKMLYNSIGGTEYFYDALNNAQVFQEDIKSIQSKCKELDCLLDDLADAFKNVDEHTKTLKTYEDLYHKEFPDVCPLCGK